MKISIIIPVYNVEKYIGKCLSSIYQQDLNECFYEVLIVNDGTLDNSMEIVKEFAIKHNNLRIINKQNGGVSSARNEGIKEAEGEFVTFVDADDWIMENSLQKIYNYLLNHSSVEVLMCNSTGENKQEHYPWIKYCDAETEYKGTEAYERGYRRGSVCGGVYKRTLLLNNDIFFPVGVRNGEDSIFFYIVLSYVNKIVFLDLPFYVVYERMGSASRTFNKEHLKIMAYSLECAHQLMLKHSVNKTKTQCDILIEMLYIQISSLTYTAIQVGNFSLNQILRYTDIKRYLPIIFKTKNRKGFKLSVLNFSYPMFYYLIKLKLIFLRIKNS